MLVCSRDFSFPINYSSEQAIRLTYDKKWIDTYAARQAELMQSSRAAACLLFDEVCLYHRERINALRPNPRVFNEGDIVLARRKVQSK